MDDPLGPTDANESTGTHVMFLCLSSLCFRRMDEFCFVFRSRFVRQNPQHISTQFTLLFMLFYSKHVSLGLKFFSSGRSTNSMVGCRRLGAPTRSGTRPYGDTSSAWTEITTIVRKTLLNKVIPEKSCYRRFHQCFSFS